MAEYKIEPAYLHLDHEHRVLMTAFGALRVVRRNGVMSKDWILVEFKTPRDDVDYWRSVRRFFVWLGEAPIRGATLWAKRSYKRLRAIALEAKHWEDTLPSEIVRWASTIMDQATVGLDCVDNGRVAMIRSTSQMRRYKAQRARVLWLL